MNYQSFYRKNVGWTMPFEASDAASSGEMDERELLQRAKSGQMDAFNELFFRYRDKALGYAKQLTRDPHLAEDIVQDALINAFLHLGKLSHAGFVPWLQTIVRNQAMMRLRRGGPHGKERPFSGFASQERDASPVDWSNVEHVVDHLLNQHGTTSSDPDEPAGILLRKEVLQTIRGMLRVLSRKERQIFEAHFFDQLSPDEIARLFDTSTDNIYKSLSRSRQKLAKERFVFDVRDSLRHRLERQGIRRCMLPKPLIVGSSYPHPDLTFPNALQHLLPYSDQAMTKHQLYGWTNYAFKINVWKQHIGPLSMHDWNTFKANALVNVGYHCRTMDVYNFAFKDHPKKPFLIWENVRLIRESIDRGVPALLHDALHPEFGLVYGYDDEKQLFYAADTLGCGEFNAALGHQRTKSLYLVIAEGRFRLAPQAQLIRLLRLIRRHARGGEAVFLSQVNGLAAYDEWIASVQGETADALGHASNVRILLDARESAMHFWDELADSWSEGEAAAGTQQREWMRQAAAAYGEVYGHFERLGERFPFPDYREWDAENRAFAAAALGEAKQAEEKAIVALEQLLDYMEQHAPSDIVIPQLVQPSPFFVF